MTEEGYPTSQVCNSLQAAANIVRESTAAAVETFSLRDLSVFVIEGEAVSIKMSAETGSVVLSQRGVRAVGRIHSSRMVELADGRLEPADAVVYTQQDSNDGLSSLF